METIEIHEQRSEGWFNQRLGKFTASTIHEIMKRGRGKGTDSFSVSLNAYIMEKVAEKVTGERKDIGSNTAMEWGTEMEESAQIRYEKETGKKVTEAVFTPMPELEDWAGGSPDGMIDWNEEKQKFDGITEYKCPYNTVVHLESIMTNDIPAMWKSKYFGQIQFNMMCTNTDYCDWVSYDPRVKSPSGQVKIIRFYRDYAYCSDLKERLLIVIDKYKEMLDKVGYTEPSEEDIVGDSKYELGEI